MESASCRRHRLVDGRPADEPGVEHTGEDDRCVVGDGAAHGDDGRDAGANEGGGRAGEDVVAGGDRGAAGVEHDEVDARRRRQRVGEHGAWHQLVAGGVVVEHEHAGARCSSVP